MQNKQNRYTNIRTPKQRYCALKLVNEISLYYDARSKNIEIFWSDILMLHCRVSSIYSSGPEHCYFMFSGAWWKYYSLIIGLVVGITPASLSAVRSFEPSLGERYFLVKIFVCYCLVSRQMYLSETTTPAVHVVLQSLFAEIFLQLCAMQTDL
jgi:hypothetical protein